MTQLLSLLNLVFENQAVGNDLEHYADGHNPNGCHQVGQLTRNYLNHFSTSEGQ